VIGAALALAGVGCAPPPEASTRRDRAAVLADAPPDQHCAFLIGKIPPGETESPILARECADTEEELDRGALSIGGTLLMTWYSNADYGGKSTRIEGHGGPCDEEGYGIGNLADPAWRNSLSSLKGWNKCNRIEVFLEPSYKGKHRFWEDLDRVNDAPTVQVHYVGAEFNDKIRSFLIRMER
jgi:hypothetical protein